MHASSGRVSPSSQTSTSAGAAAPSRQKAQGASAGSSELFVVQNDFQQEIEKTFGKEAPQVIQNLCDFANYCKEAAKSDATKEPLARFFQAFDFQKVRGHLRVQLKADASPEAKAHYETMISHLKDALDSSNFEVTNTQIAVKNGIKFWRNVGIFLALGFAIAAAIFGGYAALPIGMYICLNIAGLLAIGTITVSLFFRYVDEACIGDKKDRLYEDNSDKKKLDILLKQYGLSSDLSADRDESSLGTYFQKSTADTLEACFSNLKKQALWEYILCAVLWDGLSFAVQEKQALRCQELLKILNSFYAEGPSKLSNTKRLYILWFEAVNQGNIDVCKVFMRERGLKIDTTDQAGFTALYYAAKEGHQPLCEFLLENGARVQASASDENSCTALHYLARTGNQKIGELLLKAYCLNSILTDAQGFTVLHHAVAACNAEMCVFLITFCESGKKPFDHWQRDFDLSEDKAGRTPLDLALEMQQGNEPSKKIYSAYPYLSNLWATQLMNDFRKGNELRYQRLLCHAPGKDSMPPEILKILFFFAVSTFNKDLVDFLLLNYNQDIHVKNDKGQTVLQVLFAHIPWYGGEFIDRQRKALFEFFVQAGVDTNSIWENNENQGKVQAQQAEIYRLVPDYVKKVLQTLTGTDEGSTQTGATNKPLIPNLANITLSYLL